MIYCLINGRMRGRVGGFGFIDEFGKGGKEIKEQNKELERRKIWTFLEY